MNLKWKNKFLRCLFLFQFLVKRVARHYGTVFKSRGGKIYTGFQVDLIVILIFYFIIK